MLPWLKFLCYALLLVFSSGKETLKLRTTNIFHQCSGLASHVYVRNVDLLMKIISIYNNNKRSLIWLSPPWKRNFENDGWSNTSLGEPSGQWKNPAQKTTARALRVFWLSIAWQGRRRATENSGRILLFWGKIFGIGRFLRLAYLLLTAKKNWFNKLSNIIMASRWNKFLVKFVKNKRKSPIKWEIWNARSATIYKWPNLYTYNATAPPFGQICN